MGGLSRLPLVAGIVLVILVLWFQAGPSLPSVLWWIGNLPGDIRIERDAMAVEVPLASCLVISVIVNFLIDVFGKGR